jgi:hypothetical protein
MREFLFINYAEEDFKFAEWLTLKLTIAGYKVWCAKIVLLGGESYPKEIDKVIKERSFRFLALLSRFSINKENPTKERTLALSIARERKEDFLIPINVDGLSPTELDWMTSDLTFIPFYQSWEKGLQQLLKKLDSIGAPRTQSTGSSLAIDWVSSANFVNSKEETIWTNRFKISKLPQTLFLFNSPSYLSKIQRDRIYHNLPCYFKNNYNLWTFEDPVQFAKEMGIELNCTESFNWQDEKEIAFHNVVTHIIRRSFELYCIKRGMVWTPDNKALYFPLGLFAKEKIKFVDWTGKWNFVKVNSKRRKTKQLGEIEFYRYHLAFSFRASLLMFLDPSIQLHMRLYITDLAGRALKKRAALSRRKAICKNWWNREWLLRLFALKGWLGEGSDVISLGSGNHHSIEVRLTPLCFKAPFGVSEDNIES